MSPSKLVTAGKTANGQVAKAIGRVMIDWKTLS
jgi:hypothetical protein